MLLQNRIEVLALGLSQQTMCTIAQLHQALRSHPKDKLQNLQLGKKIIHLPFLLNFGTCITQPFDLFNQKANSIKTTLTKVRILFNASAKNSN